MIVNFVHELLDFIPLGRVTASVVSSPVGMEELLGTSGPAESGAATGHVWKNTICKGLPFEIGAKIVKFYFIGHDRHLGKQILVYFSEFLLGSISLFYVPVYCLYRSNQQCASCSLHNCF